MNELLKSFLELAEDKDSHLSVEALLTEEETFDWETLVKAFDSIDIMHVGKDLKKISKTYQLTRWQEMSILAYVKIIEMMMKRAKDAGALDLMQDMKSPPTETHYDGTMFG
tara:strand:+ start:764 stop:1096 length:333 start_codon:yes stop_codon:yes gene_type:complete